MAGTVSTSLSKPGVAAPMRKFQFDWTCTAGGVVTYTHPDRLTGLLWGVETIPGANGDRATNLPTSYGLTLTNEYSRDVLGGSGAGRSASAAEYVTPLVSSLNTPHYIDAQTLTLNISGAGNAKQGRCIVYLEDR